MELETELDFDLVYGIWDAWRVVEVYRMGKELGEERWKGEI